MTNGLARPGFAAAAWAPARLTTPPLPVSKNLGQSGDFLQSPTLALTTDIMVAAATGFFAWGLSVHNNKWSTFWWIVASMAGVKAMHDAGRVS